ncbi:MAG TPA: VanZ family protein [Candidatus Bathyarchaeia archaeon]|nr:VanZ family protein [Candidatus Bathyarchaeia archaeon]
MRVSKLTVHRFLVYVLPLLLWMAFIFPVWNRALGSSSIYTTFAHIFRWALPHASRQALDVCYIVFRKTLHVVEYGLLAYLFYRAFRAGQSPLWSRRTGLQAAAAAVAYGLLDEYLQSFVPNRFGSPYDWLIDTIGIVAAIALIARISGRRPISPPSRTESGHPESGPR